MLSILPPVGGHPLHPAVQETQVRSLGQEDPLEEGMATHSSILAWRIPWTEEPGGLCKNQPGASICGSGKCDTSHRMILGQQNMGSREECSLPLLHSAPQVRWAQAFAAHHGDPLENAPHRHPLLVLFPSQPQCSSLGCGHTNATTSPHCWTVLWDDQSKAEEK